LQSLADMILRRTKVAAGRFSQTRGVFLGGSFAKGTWLPGHVDLDVFVKIDPETSEDAFERIGLAVGRAATRGFPQGKKFAQHPYTEATIGGTRVNIVPCYSVKKGEWKSAADRSLFHAEIVGALPKSLKNEIRLLKKFMIAAGVYGAEIEIQGFSGYVAEVLVMNLGSFEDVLKYFAGFRRANDECLFRLMDPIDKYRDLGVAVSGEKLARMVLAAREFLRRPSEAYFGEMRGSEHSGLRSNIVAVVFSHQTLSEDTLWGELRKATKHLVRHLEVNGFRIARCLASSDNRRESAILMIPEYGDLPELEQRLGPTVDRRKDLEAFISSNAKKARLVWVDDDARARVLLPRNYTRLEDILKDVLAGRAGSIGLPAELSRGMKRTGTVLMAARLDRKARTARWLGDGIREISSDSFGSRPA